MAGNDLILYHVGFNQAAYMAEVKSCINIALDQLSGQMHDVLCRVISQCSEAANVMIIEAQKNVKEILRVVDNSHAEIQVGIDEGAIAGGEQAYVRVMVTLHGNGEIVTKPGGPTWKKHVNSFGPNNVKTAYRIPQFDQADHSDTMMLAFDRDMKKYIKDFLATLTTMLHAIDYTNYLTIS